MENPDLKKLAKLTILDSGINPKVSDYVLDKLSRRDLIAYLRYLKTIVGKNTARVITEKALSDPVKRQIIKMFPEKDVLFETAVIGDGIRIQINDTIIDLSLSGFINQTVKSLKNELW